MKRKQVIAVCGGLAVLAAVVPLVLAGWLAWHAAVRAEQARLQHVAGLALARTERAVSAASEALAQLQEVTLVPCSAAHLARLQAVTVNTPVVEEVGYFAGGVLRCSSWGLATARIASRPGDLQLPGGIEVHLGVKPLVGQGSTMLGLHQGDYNVLLLPSRLVDVITEADVHLGLRAAQGPWLAFTAGTDAEQFAQPAGHGWLQAQASDGQWQVEVRQPPEHLSGALGRELLWLLPIGLITAGLLVALVAWLGRRRLSPLAELELAVQHREFIVHYQPLVALASGACIGAEALVRWQRPDGSLVRPDLFIPLAEDSGLIQPITDQVIHRVLRELGPLLVAEPDLHIAVNLCAADLASGRILPVLEQALHGTGVQPAQLWLEATERGFMDVEGARRTIDAARARGHVVAIDDFGTGYSSLQYLQGLALDALKIDKAFIDTIGARAATSSVTGHIIDMARELGLKIVAEGVETAAQAEYLRVRQVDYGQGWLYAKALPAGEFIAWYRQHSAAPQPLRASVPATE